jgi:adenine-specific DNA-methyltransferase
MTKLKMHTPDLVADNIEWIATRFPGCITESRNDKGEVVRAVDFDLLRQELSTEIVEGPQERYHLNWPGKREALLAANAPIAKTLRPCRAESVDFDTTRNLFIEGDNLDALKLLQETYLNKVKMIYIDPPYNTGRDFIYDDDFAADAADFLLRSGQTSEVGTRLVSNTETNGRFHSDWLSMMYPRLRLARSLLREDGVIFVSIDDGEVASLRKLCDELFGEDNFVTQIVWKKRSTPPNDKAIGAQHDYIIVYAKSLSAKTIFLRPRSDEQDARYTNPDGHPKGPWAAGDLMANVKGGRYVESLHFAIVNPATGESHFPSSNGNWRFSRDTIGRLLSNNEIYFGIDGKGRPKLKRFLCDVKEGITWTSLWDFVPLNTDGSREMQEIFGNPGVFENPKPVGLLKEILRAGSRGDDIVMDFFAGSASLAHAVMSLNAEDGGKRRFLMVQLSERCDDDTEAWKAGFETIADISKERIRRAGKLVVESAGLAGTAIDIGTRVFRVDSSNMKDVYYRPDEATPALLGGHVDNIKSDRTDEDLLFQVLLDWGVDLSLPIATESICGKPVYLVDTNALAACFASGIDEAFVKELAKRKPLRVVFRDSSYGSDDVKINVEQIFKQLSPGTEVRTL